MSYTSVYYRAAYFWQRLSQRTNAACLLKLSGHTRLYSSTNDDYQFLQRSKIPTMHFQKSLPRLPIPELHKSCQRYLDAVQPIVSSQDFARTQQIVAKFQSEDGKRLHEELVSLDKKNKHTSYISVPWFDMYLKSRVPIPINFNPFMVLKKDVKLEYNDQVVRATNLLISSLRFMKSLRANCLEPEVYHLNAAASDNNTFRTVTRLLPERLSWYGAYWFKAFPLDMSQFGNLFNSTRIPKPGRDQIVSDPKARHMLVLYKGNHYVFDALDENGNILPAADLLAIIKYISDQTCPTPKHSIGYLSTQDRDSWAAHRAHLEATGNAEQLKTIDSAFFALCLDDTDFGSDFLKVGEAMLHGPAYNRWFDKSYQLIVDREGCTGLNFEHSWGDGVAVLRYMTNLFEDSTTNQQIHPTTKPSNLDCHSRVKKLDFVFDDKAKAFIDQAKADYEKTVSGLSLTAGLNNRITKDSLKQHKISPDSVVQLAFQLAYYRAFGGKTIATYESCSTSAFKHGRTETVRPVTKATKAFVEAYCRKNQPSTTELRQLINQCSKNHGQLTKEAAMGQGFDRHLFALKDLAQRKGEKIPALYEDNVYQEAAYYKMSTSTLFSPCFLAGGFGPVVPDGFGIAYAFVDPWSIGVFVSSYKEHNCALKFSDDIMTSLDEIHDLLESSKPK